MPRRVSATATLALALALIFIGRWLLATRESYWYDELLSVAIYGSDHSSVAGAVRHLAKESIHPPLYQVVLWCWMRAFGTAEVVTRSLSNLYLTAASLCTFALARRELGTRRALAATLFFSLMGQPLYFALEARSYAQSLCLVTLSSWMTFVLMARVRDGEPWPRALRSRHALVLGLANVALLMTHYYNAFFLGAQTCFLLGWNALRVWRRGKRSIGRLLLATLGLGAACAAPLALQLAIWGPVMANSYRARAKNWSVGQSTENPLVQLAQIGVHANLGSATSLPVLLGLGVLAVAHYGSRIHRACRADTTRAPRSEALAWYAMVTTIAPFFIATCLFAFAGQERYVRRYFMFVAPSLALILVLSIDHAVLFARRARAGLVLAHSYFHAPVLATLVLSLALLGPGSYRYAQLHKEDWRGLSAQIADIVRNDPSHQYALYMTGFDEKPMLDYYLGHEPGAPRVQRYITRSMERSRRLRLPLSSLHGYDYLIVAFTRPSAAKFPKTRRYLDKHLERVRELMHDGFGLRVYRVKPR